jgi:hypothetical protein
MSFQELDVVRLTTDLPQDGLATGAIGTVVHIFRTPSTAYEVEFVDDLGKTVAMTTLAEDVLEPFVPPGRN